MGARKGGAREKLLLTSLSAVMSDLYLSIFIGPSSSTLVATMMRGRREPARGPTPILGGGLTTTSWMVLEVGGEEEVLSVLILPSLGLGLGLECMVGDIGGVLGLGGWARRATVGLVMVVMVVMVVMPSFMICDSSLETRSSSGSVDVETPLIA